MRQPKLTALLALLLLVALAATAAAESRKTSCNPSGRVFGYEIPHSGPLLINLTWPKSNNDSDIGVFTTGGDLIGLGSSLEPRFEQVVIGGLPFATVDILVFKFSGSNSGCYLYVGSSDGDLDTASSGAGRLRYRGSITELAARDERYARMWETLQRVVSAKRAAR